MLTYFSLNNRSTTAELDALAVYGVRLAPASRELVTAFRDPVTGRMYVTIGEVIVRGDGTATATPRDDAPKAAHDILVGTAVDCLQRSLHLQGNWDHSPATETQPETWNSLIHISPPAGNSVFEAHAEVLRPAAGPASLELAGEREVPSWA